MTPQEESASVGAIEGPVSCEERLRVALDLLTAATRYMDAVGADGPLRAFRNQVAALELGPADVGVLDVGNVSDQEDAETGWNAAIRTVLDRLDRLIKEPAAALSGNPETEPE